MSGSALVVHVMGHIMWTLGAPIILAAIIVTAYLHVHPGITRRLFRG